MRCIRLKLAYDGAEFSGWQWQPTFRTVQGVLEIAIAKITGERVRVVASGRTDAGVHALGQVAAFRAKTQLSTDVLYRALNSKLPHDVRILEVREADDDFDPIRHARRKRYRYVVQDGPVLDIFSRGHAWWIKQRLDVEAMAAAAERLLGEHDFASFQTSGSPRASTVRTIFDIRVERRSRAGEGVCGAREQVTIEVEANGFLYNMMRNIAGTLVEIGRGRQPVEWIDQALAARHRPAAGMTAPPDGLFLVRVSY